MERVEATSTKFGVFGIETDVLYQWRTLVPAYEERLTPIRGNTVRDVKVGKTVTRMRVTSRRRTSASAPYRHLHRGARSGEQEQVVPAADLLDQLCAALASYNVRFGFLALWVRP